MPNRTKWNTKLELDIQQVWKDNFRVHGVRKAWRQLLREGTGVTRCTVERLMKKLGIQGVRRGRGSVGQQCAFVATWMGFVYVAFITDVFARCIVSWEVSRSLHTDLVLDALKQVLWARRIAGYWSRLEISHQLNLKWHTIAN